MTLPMNHAHLFTALCAGQLLVERAERPAQEPSTAPWTTNPARIAQEHLADLHGLEIEAAGLVEAQAAGRVRRGGRL